MTGQQSEQFRTVRVDTHVHTAASYDGYTTPEALLDRAETIGLDAIVVTDHDTVEGARIVSDLADSYDVVAIAVCEVSTADGHLLAIGVETAPEPGRPLAATAREVRARGGLAVVPHPFQRSRHGARRSAIENVDGIEVHNAISLTNVRNTQAHRYATRNDLPAFGGSDAHRKPGVGVAATAVEVRADAELTTETILDGMRAGRTAAVGRRAPPSQYLTKVFDAAKATSISMF